MADPDALGAVSRWLEDAYQTFLEVWMVENGDLVDPARPLWRWIDGQLDLLPAREGAAGALLLDPALGLCLYLLPFAQFSRLEMPLARALAVCSRLLPEAAGQARSHDPHGPWQVVLHWLVGNDTDNDQWLRQAATLRNETAHIEEIPIDFLVADGGDWSRACDAHGFPRLLLATRALLRRDAGAVERWSSADARVREALAGARATCTTDPAVESAARELFEWLDGQAPPRPAAPPPRAAARLRWIRVEHLRNLEQLRLDLEGTGATARIVNGPNGSGKSNLFEAISLALCGASRRYLDYLADGDAPRPGAAGYASDYLCPIGQVRSAAIEWADSTGEHGFKLADKGDAPARLRTLDGTLLAQDESRAFLTMGSDQLGALVLGDYSGLAQRVNDELERRLTAAKEQKNGILRRWGLSPSITRADTATARITDAILAEELRPPKAQLGWLKETFAQWGGAGPNQTPSSRMASVQVLLADWQGWEAALQPAQEAVAADLGRDDLEAGVVRLSALTIRRDNLLQRTNAVLDDLAGLAAPLPPGIRDDAMRWGSWLEQQPTVSIPPAADLAPLLEERRKLETDLAALRRQGESLKAHGEHLQVVAAFVERHWQGDHRAHCPTCGSSVRDLYQQDIGARVAQLRQDNTTALEQARADYRRLAETLKVLDTRLRAAGVAACPIDSDRQLAVGEALTPFAPAGALLSALLAVPERRTGLFACLDRLAGLPALLSLADGAAEARARDHCQRIRRELDEVRRALAAPATWEALRKQVQQTLAAVMGRHLPDTLGQVWYELTMALTPARWQLPDRPRLQAASQRGRQQVSVRLGTGAGLARHLLNGAEAHTLGLAWFFLRYLTSGRFRHALIAMDDPAQDMDQPAYRDLCRLWATVLRLHRIHDLPLDLLVFLHQDERALDAVRATDATLHRLGWNRRVPDWLRVMRLTAGPSRFPAPLDALAGARRAVGPAIEGGPAAEVNGIASVERATHS